MQEFVKLPSPSLQAVPPGRDYGDYGRRRKLSIIRCHRMDGTVGCVRQRGGLCGWGRGEVPATLLSGSW